jgi:hypothetical protein
MDSSRETNATLGTGLCGTTNKHDRGQVEFYEFESAGALLEDFWNDVDRILNGE